MKSIGGVLLMFFTVFIAYADCGLFHTIKINENQRVTEIVEGPTTRANCGEEASFSAGISISVTAAMLNVGFSASYSLATSISWNLQGENGCINNAKHQGKGDGYITKQLVYDAYYYVECHYCTKCDYYQHYYRSGSPYGGFFTTRLIGSKDCADE